MRALFLFSIILLTLQLTGQHYSPGPGEPDADWLEQHLYKGIEWQPLYPSATGHEFFLTNNYITGDITSEGIEYSGIRMKYDICNDNLILLWQSTFPIIIDRKRTDSFILKYDGRERRFINSDGLCSDIQGFAEVLHSGHSMVLARYTKVLSINASLSSYEQFRENTKYYYVVNGTCSQIRSTKAFYDMMGDFKREVRRYIRQKNVVVSRLFPEGFALAAARYDALVTGESKE